MGVLKIQCFCNETEMQEIEKMICKKINQKSADEIDDIDELMGNLRICVDFEKSFGYLSIKLAEILDSDWDILYEDSAVLTSRLKPILEEYNKDQKAGHKLAKEILSSQKL